MIVIKNKCGCLVTTDRHGSTLVYCPKHESAPYMYEALKEICSNLALGCSMDYLYKHNLSLPLAKGQKVLAKAGGRVS